MLKNTYHCKGRAHSFVLSLANIDSPKTVLQIAKGLHPSEKFNIYKNDRLIISCYDKKAKPQKGNQK